MLHSRCKNALKLLETLAQGRQSPTTLRLN
jgi:hypothetical protein